MPTVIGHHDVKDTAHWLASPRRESSSGRSASRTSARSSTRRIPTHVAVLMDVADMDVVMAAMETRRRPRRWTTTACCPRPW